MRPDSLLCHFRGIGVLRKLERVQASSVGWITIRKGLEQLGKNHTASRKSPGLQGSNAEGGDTNEGKRKLKADPICDLTLTSILRDGYAQLVEEVRGHSFSSFPLHLSLCPLNASRFSPLPVLLLDPLEKNLKSYNTALTDYFFSFSLKHLDSVSLAPFMV